MSTLTAELLLQAWERAQGHDPLRRSLALLRTAWPDVEAQEWGAMPIGARDAHLVMLREALFGTELDTLASCPVCHEPLEQRFSTADVRPAMGDEVGVGSAATLICDGYEIAYRLPCSEDLLEVLVGPDAGTEAAVARLLERCVLDARRDTTPIPVTELPPTVVGRLQDEMAERDPGADTSVALVCPACGHAFERRFHIGAYLWDELDDWAQRTLCEVHVLASAYGWSESQILALGATRRRHYLALVQT